MLHNAKLLCCGAYTLASIADSVAPAAATGQTGSFLGMAPEVTLAKPYDEQVPRSPRC